MNIMDSKAAAQKVVTSEHDRLIELSHDLHAHPETSFEEHRSSARVADELEAAGFTVTPVNGLPTAFVARKGSGPLNIGICAEYDALPGIGHACGHNIIAAAAVGAALGLAVVADEMGLTVTVLGTPAEEHGGGKILMLYKGAFDGLHAAMMVHPHANERDAMSTLAISQLELDFHGRAAHASAHPEHGISASAALALAQTGIGMLREHIATTDRIHGIVTKGGDAPNIVPAHTHGSWYARSASLEQLATLEPRVIDVFKGAALMTGCRLEVTKSGPTYSELLTNAHLASWWRTNAANLGRTSLSVQPGDPSASTDMGNVSLAMPSIHPLLAIDSEGAGIHQPEFTQCAVRPAADRAVIDGAVGMAWTAIDLAGDNAVRNDFLQRPYSVSNAGDAPYLDLDQQSTTDTTP